MPIDCLFEASMKLKQVFKTFLLLIAFVLGAVSSHAGEILASDFILKLHKQNKLEPFLKLVVNQLSQVIKDSRLRNRLIKKLKNISTQKSWEMMDKFPVINIPSSYLSQMALGLYANSDQQKINVETYKGSLQQLAKEDCKLLASKPKSLDDLVLGLSEGHHPDQKLNPCQIHQSLRLAEILNSMLHAPSASEVFFGANKASNIRDFFKLLIDSGHHVEMRNERTFANFIAFNYEGDSVIWPTWADTGLDLNLNGQGQPVVVPLGHSHHAWRVSGPLINAKVMFYLGVSGVGFFAQVHERPKWTGDKVLYSVDSVTLQGADLILETLERAEVYFKRIVSESALDEFKHLPANGYGVLGVCNDSNAVLERVSNPTGEVSVYPLLRFYKLDHKATAFADGLDAEFAAIPKDAQKTELDRRYVLQRVAKMFPFEKVSDATWMPESLQQVYLSLMDEVGFE